MANPPNPADINAQLAAYQAQYGQLMYNGQQPYGAAGGRMTATEVREGAKLHKEIREQQVRHIHKQFTDAILNGTSVYLDLYQSEPLRTSPFITLGANRMNLSAAVMLFEENGVRPVRVEYDPDIARNNNPNVVFKTVDPALKKDDLVVVETNTRHGFTVAKVTAIGFADVPVDFENPQRWGWVVSTVDKAAYDGIIAGEKNLIGKVAEANANKMRNDLKSAMGLEKVNLADVFAKRGDPALAAPPTADPAAADPNGNAPVGSGS